MSTLHTAILLLDITLFKTVGSVRFVYLFLKDVSSAHQGCIYVIKIQSNFEMLLQFKIAVFYVNICYNVIYFCDQSCIFSIITPVFSVT